MKRSFLQRKAVHTRKLLGPMQAEIMEIIWADGPQTGMEIESRLNVNRSKPVAYNSVLIICNRLTDRKILKRQKIGRAYRYEATMNIDEFVEDRARQDTDALLKLHGAAAISFFVQQLSDDPKLIVQLHSLLDQQEGRT